MDGSSRGISVMVIGAGNNEMLCPLSQHPRLINIMVLQVRVEDSSPKACARFVSHLRINTIPPKVWKRSSPFRVICRQGYVAPSSSRIPASTSDPGTGTSVSTGVRLLWTSACPRKCRVKSSRHRSTILRPRQTPTCPFSMAKWGT